MPSSKGDSEGGDSGISPEERAELLSQIDGLFTERPPIKIAEEKTRSGAMFPLFVNVAAIAILAGGVFATGRFSNNAFQHSGSGTANYLTTEGLVVKRVKQQASEKVNATEARIAAIKKELALLKRGAGTRSTGTGNTAREKQLEKELSALQSSTNSRLAVLQAQRQQQHFFIRQLQSIYQNVGTDVSNGRVVRALNGVDSADKLLRDKAQGSSGELATVAPALMAGNTVLRAALLYGQSAQAAMKAASSSDSKAKIAAIAELVHKGDERYAAGDLTQAQSDYTKAIDTLSDLSRAYGRLTEMSKSASRQQAGQLTAQIAQLQKNLARLQATVDRQAATIARQRATIGSQRATIAEDKRQAAKQDALLASRLRQIEAQKVALQKRTEELSTVVGVVQRSLHPSGGSVGNGQIGSSEMTKLLKTKVEIRSLAETPEARKAYPGLSAYLDTFFAKYGETYANQGSAAALNQVASALNNIIVTLNLKLQSNGISQGASPTGMLDRPAGAISAADPVASYLQQIDATLTRISAPAAGG